MKWWAVTLGLAMPLAATAQGFDARLVEAVADIEPGAYALIEAGAYILGLGTFGAGLFRLVRMSDRSGRSPAGAGTVMCFAIGTVMLSFPAWLESGGVSLFGEGPRTSALSYGGGTEAAAYDALLAALFAIVQFVGVVSFLRGWFVLRAAADGWARATMGSGVWHIVGGLLAWHIVPVLDAVQTTVGVELLRPQ